MKGPLYPRAGELWMTGGERDHGTLWPTALAVDGEEGIDLPEETLVLVLGTHGHYTRVVTQGGVTGWVWTEDLRVPR